MSCPPSGRCVAVGYVGDIFSSTTAAASTQELDGTFAQSTLATAPANSGFTSVSCSASGDCTAVGYAGGSPSELVADTMAGGTWGSAEVVALPSDATTGHAELSSVSCTSPGNCIAVGVYQNATSSQGIVAVQSGGTFAQAVAITPPAPGDYTNLTGVSCGSATSCEAVGLYVSSQITEEPIVVPIASGVPGSASASSLPSGVPFGSLSAVDCTAATSCEMVGNALTGDFEEPFYSSIASGAPGPAVLLSLPADLDTQPNVEFDGSSGISCVSFGNCAVSSNYLDTYLGRQSVVYTESSGVFSAPQSVDGTGYGTFTLNGISCVAPLTCAAVGSEVSGTNQSAASTAVGPLAKGSAGAGRTNSTRAPPKMMQREMQARQPCAILWRIFMVDDREAELWSGQQRAGPSPGSGAVGRDIDPASSLSGQSAVCSWPSPV